MAPVIPDPLEPGDDTLTGEAAPNRMDGEILICLIGTPGGMPAMPPCTAPDTQIGACGTNGAGQLTSGGLLGCPLTMPLEQGQCLYAYDTITMLISNIRCAFFAAPVPALSGRMLGVALALLTLVATLAMRRTRPEGSE